MYCTWGLKLCQTGVSSFDKIFCFCKETPKGAFLGGLLQNPMHLGDLCNSSLACRKQLHDHIILLRGETWSHKTSLSHHFLLKCLYQARKLISHVFICMGYPFCLFLQFWNCFVVFLCFSFYYLFSLLSLLLCRPQRFRQPSYYSLTQQKVYQFNNYKIVHKSNW